MADGYAHTTNFNLSLYQDKTPADLRDGYNNSMRAIDDNMLSITNGVNRANQNLTALGADTPEKATALATDIANGNTAHHLLTHMGIIDDTSADEHINDIKQSHTDTQNNTNALTALGAETVDKAAALKNTVAENHRVTTANTNALTALGAETVNKATSLKNTIDHKIDKIAGSRLIFLADSWGEGYYNLQKHRNDSPIVTCCTMLGITNYQNLASSASGWVPTGDYGNFETQWDKVADKNTVDYVVILGGQNDAAANTTYATEYNAVNALLAKVTTEAPNAKVHIFEMPLQIGQCLTDSSSTSVSRRLDCYTAVRNAVYEQHYPNVQFHDGVYRWGVTANNPDPNDTAHLLANGYQRIGGMMAYCIQNNTDIWPTTSVGPQGSETSGEWKFITIAENHGMILLKAQINVNANPINNKIFLKLPAWARRGTPSYYKLSAWGADNIGFLSHDPNTDTLNWQGVNNPVAHNPVTLDVTYPAGY